MNENTGNRGASDEAKDSGMSKDAIGSDSGSVSNPKSGNPSDLQTRVISALILAAVTLGFTWFGGVAFGVLMTIMSLLIYWEWGRISKGQNNHAGLRMAGGLLLAISLGAMLYDHWQTALLILLAGILALFAWSATQKQKPWASMGMAYAAMGGMSLYALRNDEFYGLFAIIFLFAIVWCADIGAYFAGRAIGGPKLAPRISPKKTWAGFIGGMCAAMIAGLFTASFFDIEQGIGLALCIALIGLVSQLGDLFESAFKRHFKVKDSSNLIPGHGGVMDRVDGLIFAGLTMVLIAWFGNGGEAFADEGVATAFVNLFE